MELAEAMSQVPGVHGQLSLSDRAEILGGPSPPHCDLPMPTYNGIAGFVWRLFCSPFLVPWLVRRLHVLRPDLVVCAMPGPLDPVFLVALRVCRVPVVVVVHDADPHPGDVFPMMLKLQRVIVRRANAVVTLSAHVAQRLREQGLVRPGVRVVAIGHPPRDFGPAVQPLAHGGPLRLLFFGRLLPYKGLDLLADALRALGPRADLETRIVGSGPESPPLSALRGLPGVTVENRWVPEHEIGTIIAWADALVLPYREASQSGAAAAAIAACRFVVATQVGGLVEQVRDYALARLCDPDPSSIAAALDGLLKDRGTVVPYTHHSNSSWQSFARAILDVAATAPGEATV